MKSSSVAVCVFFSLLVASSLAVYKRCEVTTLPQCVEHLRFHQQAVWSKVRCRYWSAESSVVPHIIIWAPGEQFPHLFPNGLKCPKCHKENADDPQGQK